MRKCQVNFWETNPLFKVHIVPVTAQTSYSIPNLNDSQNGILTLHQKGRIIGLILDKRNKSCGISKFLHQWIFVHLPWILVGWNRRNNEWASFQQRTFILPQGAGGTITDCHQAISQHL